MDNTVKNALTSVVLAILVGVGAFLFSYFNLFVATISNYFYALMIAIGLVIMIAALIALVFADKTRSLQEAVCSCGKLIFISTGGLIITSFVAFLLAGGTNAILRSLSIGITFFFLTLVMTSVYCFIYNFYRCHKINC